MWIAYRFSKPGATVSISGIAEVKPPGKMVGNAGLLAEKDAIPMVREQMPLTPAELDAIAANVAPFLREGAPATPGTP